MRVVLSTISKFHHFELARQLERRGVLQTLFTGRPSWKLRNEALPPDKVVTFPFFQTIYEGLARLGINNYPWRAEFNRWCHSSFDAFVARCLPECDVFHALAYCGLQSGLAAQQRGALWACDAINCHLVFQDDLLAAEYDRVGLPYKRQDQRLLDYAVDSYNRSDLITVPSRVVKRSFVSKGIPESKIAVVPYGVDLRQYHPVEVERDNIFRVLFVGQLSIRKGVHDLIAAFRLAAIPNSKLILVGPQRDEAKFLLNKGANLNIELAGVQPHAKLSTYYSQADALVLPSIEEGFGLVIAEALACGCPVIASDHTGGSEILSEGVDGFVVPIHAPQDIAAKLVWLYEHADQRQAMRRAARNRVASLGRWDFFGEANLDAYSAALQLAHGAARR